MIYGINEPSHSEVMWSDEQRDGGVRIGAYLWFCKCGRVRIGAYLKRKRRLPIASPALQVVSVATTTPTFEI
jgi:hypothetical protein